MQGTAGTGMNILLFKREKSIVWRLQRNGDYILKFEPQKVLQKWLVLICKSKYIHSYIMCTRWGDML